MKYIKAICVMIILFSCSQKESGLGDEIGLNKFNGMEDLVLNYVVENGHFAKSGITPMYHLVKDGNEAVELLIEKKIDFAFVSPFVFVKKIMEGADIRYLANYLQSRSPYKVATQTKLNIESYENLEGKRIGIEKGTQYEFVTEYFFTYNNLDIDSLTFVDIEASNTVEYFANDLIDATLAGEPELSKLKAALGEKISFMDVNMETNIAMGIIVRSDHDVEASAEFLSLLDKGIRDINNDLVNDPKNTEKILGYPAQVVSFIKNMILIKLQLDNLTILSAESEARWLLLKDEFRNNKMPDIDLYFDRRPLDLIRGN